MCSFDCGLQRRPRLLGSVLAALATGCFGAIAWAADSPRVPLLSLLPAVTAPPPGRSAGD